MRHWPWIDIVTFALWAGAWAAGTVALIEALDGRAVAAILYASAGGAALVVAGIRPLGILAWHGLEAIVRAAREKPPPR